VGAEIMSSLVENASTAWKYSCRVWCLAPIITWFFLGGCGLCGNELGYEEAAPDGKLKAVVFERDCGATTHASTQISILAKSEHLPNKSGNIFIARGDLKIRMHWNSDSELLVTYPPGTDVSLKERQRGKVSVRYVESSTE
jgi:hypothetical protein